MKKIKRKKEKKKERKKEKKKERKKERKKMEIHIDPGSTQTFHSTVCHLQKAAQRVGMRARMEDRNVVLCGFLVLSWVHFIGCAPNIIKYGVEDLDLASRVAGTSSISCVVRSRCVPRVHVLFLISYHIISYHTSTTHEGVMGAGRVERHPCCRP